jgi:glycine cleavage system H lipoate-binding protein
MKKGIMLSILLLLFTTCFGSNLKEEKIRILSSPSSYDLSTALATQYNKLSGAEKIEIVRLDPVKGNKLSEGNLYFLSGQETRNYDPESSWKIVVARDVIVPVISSGNPFIAEILHKGITPSKLAKLIMNGNQITWGTLLDDKNNKPAVICFVENERIASSIADFLDADVKSISGKHVQSQDMLFEEMKKDPAMIGICRLADVMDPDKQLLRPDIALLPIDRDENGVIDHTEDIYTDYSAFNRGVWIGKYPRALFSNIYSVSASQPQDAEVMAFLKWVLDEGQKFIPSAGYTDLLAYESQTGTEKLLPVVRAAEPAPAGSIFRTLLVVFAVMIAAGFILNFIAGLIKKPEARVPVSQACKVLDESLVNLPRGLYFDKTHTWAFMEPDGSVRIGIDDFLHHITGPLTRIKMKSEGDKVKKGEEILSVIRNGKQLNLYAPVSGTIQLKNRLLETDISKLNSAPYTDGWVYTVKPDNWSRENHLLLVADRQREFIKGEISRLKDFLGTIISGDMQGISHQVVLQDGGALLDAPLAEMEPVVWEEFQAKFIDPSRQVWFYELF